MIEGRLYKYNKSLFWADVDFIFQKGFLYRVTNNPNDLPKNFTPVFKIYKEDWTLIV